MQPDKELIRSKHGFVICTKFGRYAFRFDPPCSLASMLVRLKARLAQLDEMVADPTLYEDSTKANKLVTERSKVEGKLQTVGRLTAELESWIEMHGERPMVRKKAVACHRLAKYLSCRRRRTAGGASWSTLSFIFCTSCHESLVSF